MTEEEIRDWLGFAPGTRFRDKAKWQRIVTGMRDVPAPPPGPADEHARVFAAYLRCAGPPPAADYRHPAGPACADWEYDMPYELQSGDCPHDSCWGILTSGRIRHAPARWRRQHEREESGS